MDTRQSYRKTLLVLAFALIFLSSTSFRVRDYADKSLDVQTLLKLIGIGATLLVPMAVVLSGRLQLTRGIVLLWLGFLIALVASSVNSPAPFVSLTDSVAFLGCFLFCCLLSERLEEADVVALIMSSIGVISILSILVYYINPELGRMHAWLGSEFGANNRIKGIVGSPNGLGSMTSIALIMATLYFHKMGTTARALSLASAPFALLCLVMSENRMSMLALVLCVGIWLLGKGNKAVNLLLVSLAACVVTFVFLAAPETILTGLSRSGDAQEIATGTGRAQIWSVVIEMIGQKLVLGHGYAAAPFILPNDPRLFSVAAHSHNMYLEILFAGGIVSFGLFIMAMSATLVQGFRYHAHEALIILFFFLFRGITEPTPFSGLPSFGGYAFFIAVAFIVTRAKSGERRADLLIASDNAARLVRARETLRRGRSLAR